MQITEIRSALLYVDQLEKEEQKENGFKGIGDRQGLKQADVTSLDLSNDVTVDNVYDEKEKQDLLDWIK